MNLCSNKRGFTLFETLVGSAIFLVVALSAYKAFGVLMDAVSASQSKIAATLVANERFEIARNLPYEDVGLINGIPSGVIDRDETVIKDNYSFDVETTIRNIDDTFDGTIGGTPSDPSPADYKMVDIDITCNNCKIFNPLKFTTLITPRDLETASTNGALFIQVYDAAGILVPGASVHIVNTVANPDIIIDDVTDNTGWVRIVDAPPGANAYNVTVTKPGYSTDQTYPIGGAAGVNPLKPDANVVLQQVTQASLSIDKTGSIAVSSINSSCAATPTIGFSLTGTKIIGAPAVLKYPTQSFTTDGAGSYLLSNMEWDTYTTLITNGTYDLAGANPFPSFALSPEENKTLQLLVVPHVNRALLISVVDSNGLAIDGASVRLQKLPFDDTQTTNSGLCPTPGQVFWNGLGSGVYNITVSKSGYQDSTAQVNLSSAWQSQTITLIP